MVFFDDKKINIETKDKHQTVPSSRVSRFSKIARLASGIAGGMVAEGTQQLLSGKMPRAKDMLLTPGNAKRLSDRLAEMRGAAMKLGQMLSMDSGDFLPPELAEILERLRASAHFMPDKQLHKALISAYGEDWQAQFKAFQKRPIAAASIGQVHRATSLEGRDIVLKIQYPGIAKSIDSDVDNIATLIRLSGLLPKGIDLKPLLNDTKTQLKNETDYLKELKFINHFSRALADDDRFQIPAVFPELTHKNVLAMTYLNGGPIEQVAEQPQGERNRVMSALFELMFTEFFELRMMQTDPNFANYLYDDDSGAIVLLDFGATRKIKADYARAFKGLIKAVIADDRKQIAKAAEKCGYLVDSVSGEYRELMVELFQTLLEPLSIDEAYDFSTTTVLTRLSELGEQVQTYKDLWHVPPSDSMYVHRKLGGMFMLASRIKAKVNLYKVVSKWVD